MSYAQVISQTKARAGKLNRRISIQELSPGQDDQGGEIEQYTTLLENVPAEIVHLTPSKTGDELFIAHQLYASQMILIRIRYRASTSFNAGMRVLYRSKHYRVRSVSVPDEALNSVFLECQEIQTKGSTA